MYSSLLMGALLVWQQSSATPTPRYLPRNSSSAGLVTSKIALKQAGRSPASSRALFSKLDKGSATLQSAESGNGYAVEIGFGGTTFSVIFDTGSSDLWLPSSDFKCVDYRGKSVPTAECGFDQTVSTGFSGGQIDNANFNITYGDGEFLTGEMGYEDVTLAGITVTKQEAALVNYGYWNGDNQTDGLMGFAYPSLTSAFSGDDPTVDNPNTNGAEYKPFLFSAIDQGLLDDKIFTMILERGVDSASGSGELTIGSLPASVAADTTFVTTPLRAIKLTNIAATAQDFSYYTIIPDGFTITPGLPANHTGPLARRNNNETSTFASNSSAPDLLPPRAAAPFAANSQPMIVDSGTTLMYLPFAVVHAIVGAFRPPAQYIRGAGIYEAPCTAIPPSVAIRIGGHDFPIDPQDLLLTGDLGQDPSTGGCILGVQSGGSGPFILGDTFMKNVVSVFDVGKSEMRFAPYAGSSA